MGNLPLLGIPEWANGPLASPWLVMSKFMRIVEGLAEKGSVKSRSISVQPTSTLDGDRYLIAAGATGTFWAGQDGKFATSLGDDASNGWYIGNVAREGFELYIEDEAIKIARQGGAWVPVSLGDVSADVVSYNPADEGVYASTVEQALDELYGALKAIPAEYVQYAAVDEGFYASNVRDALDEVVGAIRNLEQALATLSISGVPTLSELVSYTPVDEGFYSANVRDALDELIGAIRAIEERLATIGSGGGGGGSSTFLGLTDTPSSYSGQAGKALFVKSDETAVEFQSLSTGGFQALNVDYADAGNTTTTETDLYSHSIAASTLSVNGDRLEVKWAGTFVSSGTATRQIRCYFGGTLFFDSGALTISVNGTEWVVTGTITRVSGSVVRCTFAMATEGATLADYTQYTEITGLTLSNANTLKITGTAAGVGAATNDIVGKAGAIDKRPFNSSLLPVTPLLMPQGRLTLVTGTPVMTSDQTAKSTIYYTQDKGDLVPVWNGSGWDLLNFTELVASLDTTNHLLNNVYDLFAYKSGGAAAIGLGPAWSYSATVTMTIASPCVVTWTGHSLREGDPIIFTTSGALPTGITAGTTYYVGRSPAANTFNVSTTVANAAAGTFVNTSGSQSGTHTGTNHTRQRGTGSGTTELERKNGLFTNKQSITLTNGAGAGVSGIAANTATLLGSAFMTANGQTGMAFKPAASAGGANPMLALWNAHNRVLTSSLSRDGTSGSWTYASTTWRGTNGNVNNRVWFLDGIGESLATAKLLQAGNISSGSFNADVGTNINATTGAPESAAATALTTPHALAVTQDHLPVLGMNYVQAMEVAAGGGTATFFGVANSNQLQSLTVSVMM